MSRAWTILAAGVVAIGGIAAAETPMTAAEFESYVTGRTVHFGSNGAPYGVEQYLSNRRVRWAFTDDICQEGFWYEKGDQICFLYDGETAPQCWVFWKDGRGLAARFENDPQGTVLYELKRTTQPLGCRGPDVGV